MNRPAKVGPRRRNPNTRHDVADVLDEIEHIRWCVGGDQTDRLRRGLECEAASKIARDPETHSRGDQAGDLLRVIWSFRRPSVFFPDRPTTPVSDRLAQFYATRREPAWALAQYADTLRLLVGHLGAQAREVAELTREMAAICPAAVPTEDAPAIALALAEEWRAALRATEDALSGAA